MSKRGYLEEVDEQRRLAEKSREKGTNRYPKKDPGHLYDSELDTTEELITMKRLSRYTLDNMELEKYKEKDKLDIPYTDPETGETTHKYMSLVEAKVIKDFNNLREEVYWSNLSSPIGICIARHDPYEDKPGFNGTVFTITLDKSWSGNEQLLKEIEEDLYNKDRNVRENNS